MASQPPLRRQGLASPPSRGITCSSDVACKPRPAETLYPRLLDDPLAAGLSGRRPPGVQCSLSTVHLSVVTCTRRRPAAFYIPAPGHTLNELVSSAPRLSNLPGALDMRQTQVLPGDSALGTLYTPLPSHQTARGIIRLCANAVYDAHAWQLPPFRPTRVLSHRRDGTLRKHT